MISLKKKKTTWRIIFRIFSLLWKPARIYCGENESSKGNDMDNIRFVHGLKKY